MIVVICYCMINNLLICVRMYVCSYVVVVCSYVCMWGSTFAGLSFCVTLSFDKIDNNNNNNNNNKMLNNQVSF